MGFRREMVELFAWFLGVDGARPRTDAGHAGDCAALLLSEVKNPDHYFYLAGTIPLKNLCDLEKALGEMDNATFAMHVDKSKNDFAVWVRDVVRDYRLATKLQKFRSREMHARAVKMRVGFLKQKAGPDWSRYPAPKA